jgi:hypothetical protein
MTTFTGAGFHPFPLPIGNLLEQPMGMTWRASTSGTRGESGHLLDKASIFCLCSGSGLPRGQGRPAGLRFFHFLGLGRAGSGLDVQFAACAGRARRV